MLFRSHFGPDGHEMRVINSLIRDIVCVSYFYGQGRTFSTMGFCWVKVVGSTRKNVELVGSSTRWATDGTNVLVFFRTVTTVNE